MPPSRRTSSARGAAAAPAPRKSLGRSSKRAASPAPSESGGGSEAEAEAEFEAQAGKRSYNALGYWDARYVQHFAKQGDQLASDSKGTDGSAETNSEKEAESDAPAGRSAKRARQGQGQGQAAAKSKPSDSAQLRIQAPAGDDINSADITDEWYYSYNDLAPMLSKALRGVDRAGAVLDVGCGLSSFFEDLQRGGAQEWQHDQKKQGDAASAASAASAAAAASTPVPAVVSGPGFTGPCIGIDYSPAVIAHLQQQYPNSRHPQLHWICADACYLIDDPQPAHSGKKGKAKGGRKGKQAAAEGAEAEVKEEDAAAAGSGPPPLSAADRARFFRPGTFSLILDKATSDGMLCSDATALLTPLIYSNVARLLAPGGLFVVASVNEPESGWFGEYVVSSLIEHGGEDVRWDIEVHAPANYTDGEEGAPFLYVIRKSPVRAGRAAVTEQREAYTIKRIDY